MKTRFIQVRVTRSQYERIKNNAEANGFVTISAYIRALALDKDLAFQKKFNEMYTTIMNGDKRVDK